MEQTISISISGMHCSGCKNLITMSLEDEGMKNVQVDEKAGRATFISDKENDALRALLDRVFSELKDYHYSELTVLK
ncbi:MAG: heavy-metal-associated domain-containing protein [Candidatus Komeilibacteria bacterium]|nr:heavy-metal-associated domain-containing protein [Candidatus Komeilibacteria bacterium]